MAQRKPWHRTFFDGLYGKVLAALFEPERSLNEARLIKRLAGWRKGQRVLDVPCGQGRLTIPLAEMGLRMTGVDQCESYVLQARRTAQSQGVDLRFECGDMRKIEFDAEFDGAFNWFGSFGYFSDEENLRFLRRVFAALKPRGVFVLEGMNKSWLLDNFRSRRTEQVGGVTLTHRSRWDKRTSRIRDTWSLSAGTQEEVHVVTMRIYNGTEIRSVLQGAGFREIRLYGYPKLGRLTRHAKRWIAIGRRPL